MRAALLSLSVIWSVPVRHLPSKPANLWSDISRRWFCRRQQCPAILCTVGRVWGGLQGTYQFTMTTLQNSVAVPSIQFFTGDSEVTTKSGDLVHGTDTGSIDLGPNGGFASLITFNGGTGAHVNATGQIRLRGQLDMAEGTTTGDYIGSICTP